MPGSEEKDFLDLDSILLELGQFGRYQRITYCYILLPIMFSAVYNSQYIFAAGAVTYRCAVPECESTPPEFDTNGWGVWALPEDGGRCYRLTPLGDTCAPDSFHLNETQSCSSWIYESNNTIVSEFDLACQEWKRTMVGTIHSAGVFLALPLTAFVSDTFGRRTAFILTAVSAGVVGVVRAFSNSYSLYMVLEFLEAALGAGVYSAGFILALEMVGIKSRVLGGNIISCTFAIGQVVVALIAWAVPYWRTLTLIIYAPALLFVLYYFALEESVRWLLSKGRKKEAANIIFKAAEINKKKLSPATIKLLTEEPGDSKTQETVMAGPDEPKMQSLFLQVIKSKTLVSRVCICSFWWITVTFVYYGLSINSVSLAGNSYVNYILISLVEIPGYAISVVTLDRFGRKSSIITAFFICGIALIVLPFVPNSLQWLQITLNLISKLSVSMAFSSIYIYTSELMPTEVRHSLLGACSMFGRIGSLLAPQTPLLVIISSMFPTALFVIMLSNVGKLSISMIFASIYIYTIELFPTSCRHTLMNICSMIGRIGSMSAPQTPLLMEYWESLPYLVFGVMAAASGLLMLLTPETLRIRLPDTVQQAENIDVAPRTKHRTDIIVD